MAFPHSYRLVAVWVSKLQNLGFWHSDGVLVTGVFVFCPRPPYNSNGALSSRAPTVSIELGTPCT